MIKDDQDIKSLDVEGEGELHSSREFLPHQSWGQQMRHRIGLVLLGLICLAAVATVAFGISGRRFDTAQKGLQDGVKSVNRTTSVALAALKQKQAGNVKTLAKLDAMVKNLTEVLKDTKLQLQDQIAKLRVTLWTVNCDMERTKHNQTGAGPRSCCPTGWASSLGSCYWFSKEEKSWEEAKVDCEDKGAHLAIITSYQEQQFVSQGAKPRYTWIGLTAASGSWKWVDGAEYTMRRTAWRPGQPPTFPSYLSREQAYCAHVYRDGLWSTESCTRQFSWVCEVEVRG
ncbi:hypothetical protein lerEdw1_006454 [Lerista edwardsae]|nr:hypothetical protein lerEdw1_006454 [Lerista edwardsae]